MDQLLDFAQKVWVFLTVSENAGAIQTIIAAVVLGWAIITKPWTWFKRNGEQQFPAPNSSVPNDHPIVTLTLQQFEERIAKEITEAQTNLKTAHDAEKIQLLQKIEELRKRAAHPEQALNEAKTTIAKLEDTLTREGNDIGEARMAKAREALEAGDFSIADDIFAEIEAREQLAVERTARAAYARGEIAAQDIRWADAAEHYARAAALHPTFDHLHSAREFAWRNGEYAKAIPLGKDLLKIAKAEFGDTHEKYAEALNEHAITLQATGKYDLAEPLYKQAIKIDKQTLGENHPDYATRLNNLAVLYRATGKYDLAEPLYKQAKKIDKQTIGENHPEYAIRLSNLAGLYSATGKYDLAEPLFKQAIKIGKQTIGENHPDYAIRLNNLAELYHATGKYDLAEPLFKQAIKIGKQTLGENHPSYATHINNLAELYRATGKYDLAEPLFKQAIEIGKQTLGENHPAYATHINNLAGLYDATGKYDLAEPLYNQAISILEAALGPDHPNTITVKANYQNFLKSRP